MLASSCCSDELLTAPATSTSPTKGSWEGGHDRRAGLPYVSCLTLQGDSANTCQSLSGRTRATVQLECVCLYVGDLRVAKRMRSFECRRFGEKPLCVSTSKREGHLVFGALQMVLVLFSDFFLKFVPTFHLISPLKAILTLF